MFCNQAPFQASDGSIEFQVELHPTWCHSRAKSTPCNTRCATYSPHKKFKPQPILVTPRYAVGKNKSHWVPMEMAATRCASPTPNSAFCIVTDSASPATVMPVNRSGNTAFDIAS